VDIPTKRKKDTTLGSPFTLEEKRASAYNDCKENKRGIEAIERFVSLLGNPKSLSAAQRKNN